MISKSPSGNIFNSSQGYQVAETLQGILRNVECSICMPYELSIIECDRIISALRNGIGNKGIELKASKGKTAKIIENSSAFDVWEFIFEKVYALPTGICTLVHPPTNSIIYWDDDEKFVVIAGSKEFCDNVLPHSYEVLELYYIQSSLTEFENEAALKECFAQLTSNKQ